MDYSFDRTSSHGFNQAERWAWLTGGGALLAFGIAKRSWLGSSLAAAGGYLVYSGIRNQRPGSEFVGSSTGRRTTSITRTITIDRSPEELYQAWHSLEDLPGFLSYLEYVRPTDSRRSHWKVRAVGIPVEWDAEITADEPGRTLAWRSLPNSPVQHAGVLRFYPAPRDRGSVMEVRLEYSLPGGALGRALATLFGRDPEQATREALRRFKMYMETGEIATIDGQPSGERSARFRLREVMDPNPVRREPAATRPDLREATPRPA